MSDQASILFNSHQAAMNSQMQKYSASLMKDESEKRGDEMLEDNVGMELIQMGLQGGKLGEMGKHLASKVIGKEALSKAGAIKDAVSSFTEGGHAGVLEKFAKGAGISADKLKEMLPDGLHDRLTSQIRSTYVSAAEAAKDLGEKLTGGLRDQLEKNPMGPIIREGGASSSALAGRLDNMLPGSGAPALPRPADPSRALPSLDEFNQILEGSASADFKVTRQPAERQRPTFEELNQKYSAPEIRGDFFKSYSGKSFKPKSYRRAVQQVRENPDALASSVAKSVKPAGEWIGSEDQAAAIDSLNQQSAIAREQSQASQVVQRSELERSSNALALEPRNVLKPEAQIMRPVQRPKMQVDFADEAAESELRVRRPNLPEEFIE